ncbi:hypothetical protein DNTS_011415 [Danionella cerebrum]|uniref:Uncharacterized protein n=1 Tax=Danionella cerebrum TaxID=2873325 RepID=A0A553PVY6_9TELE|nr:hypothetical protein DNTS_011415 [Danionella translucida]
MLLMPLMAMLMIWEVNNDDFYDEAMDLRLDRLRMLREARIRSRFGLQQKLLQEALVLLQGSRKEMAAMKKQFTHILETWENSKALIQESCISVDAECADLKQEVKDLHLELKRFEQEVPNLRSCLDEANNQILQMENEARKHTLLQNKNQEAQALIQAIIGALLKRQSTLLPPSRKCQSDTGSTVESTFSRKKTHVTSPSLSLSESARQPIHQQTAEQNRPFSLRIKALQAERAVKRSRQAFLSFWNTSCCEFDLLASTNSLVEEVKTHANEEKRIKKLLE